ncbi:hypothetical protein L3X38_016706 [Prunus dulcis]|uniref:NB-ARC domain-containing protein n=1 Tax=Prunus dulcis TaxID=3755 RepID=A0AAD4Z936_PRUDU|nr:hypothetical protein L3X38_016706 [Prunus dulcis]
MDKLRGSFLIWYGKNLKDTWQAKEAHLVNKNCLVSLQLNFSLDMWQPEPIQEETVNALQPPPNLESLSIDIYCGTRLRPHWMTSLNKLRSLEALVIVNWDRLKKVGVEFLGIDGTIETKTSSSRLILFPNLKRLEFHSMLMWEEWEGMTGWSEEEDSQKTITIMPCLSSLLIHDCRVLRTLPNFLRNTPLKELVIEVGVIFIFLAPVAQGCRKGRGEWPKISHIPNIKVGKEFVQNDGVYEIDDDEMPSVASTSSSAAEDVHGSRIFFLIHESVKGMKFLLVLDDVWNQDCLKWEQLKLPLQNGAVGSRILATTRKEEVARMVGAFTDMVNLEVLSEDNCWALFYHIALSNREKK